MSDTSMIYGLSEIRRNILTALQNAGHVTTVQLAEQLQISDEGARQHLVYMENRGWVRRRIQRSETPRSGRPVVQYEITEKGDQLFPKNYDAFSLTLIDTVIETYGPAAFESLLSAITDKQVAVWEARLRGKTLREKLEILTELYIEGDSFFTVKEEDGDLYLTEVNCPIRAIVMKYPQMCSATISTLARLIGFKIERIKKFQAGDGRCVFKIRRDQPVAPNAFRFEFEKVNGTP